jgi:hypothetical protein
MSLMSPEPGRSIATGVFAAVVCSCGGPPTVPLEPADLRVLSVTTGLPLPDGYTISLNNDRTGHLDTNDSLVFAGLDPGEYTLELSPLPVDCRVTGENPRTVTLVAGNTTQSVFQVRCIPPNSGTLLVRTATYGNGPSRYEIILDDGLFVEPIFNDELLTLFPVPVGTRIVMIEGVPPDCQLVGANPRFIIIREPGSLAGKVFKTHCPG